MNSSVSFTRFPIGFAGQPDPSASLFVSWAANVPVDGASRRTHYSTAYYGAAITTSADSPALFAAPKDKAENAEEDEADLELETDEEQSQLPQASHRPGVDDGSPAARGDDTINPSFP